MGIKPKRGKHLALKVSTQPLTKSSCKKLRKGGKHFSVTFMMMEQYVLVFESGDEPQFLPGTSASKEFFSLK